MNRLWRTLRAILRETWEDVRDGVRQDVTDVVENIVDLFRGSKVAYPEPSAWDCGAPWNEDDEGGCDCMYCRKQKREDAKAERDIDNFTFGGGDD